MNVAEKRAVSACKNKVVSKDEWMKLYAVSQSRATSLQWDGLIHFILDQLMLALRIYDPDDEPDDAA